MDNGALTSSDLVRIVGMASIGVGIAWALQTLGVAGDGTTLSRLIWAMAAAAICGAGAGLLVTAGKFREAEAVGSYDG